MEKIDSVSSNPWPIKYSSMLIKRFVAIRNLFRLDEYLSVVYDNRINFKRWMETIFGCLKLNTVVR